MKLTVLIDNNTLIDRYFSGEPGFCLHIDCDNLKILFDLGYSDMFIRNAQRRNISLTDIDYVVVSHGHLDHTWGFEPLIRLHTEMKIEKVPHKTPVVVAHPKTFVSVTAPGFDEIGANISKEKLAKHFELSLWKEPQWLSDNLVFLGEIPRTNDFEGKTSFGTKDGETEQDYVPEDSALVYRSEKGLVIITGCSHSGICNITEYARKVCNGEKVYDIIGGFHLLDPPESQMEKTLEYINNLGLEKIHACHCTDLKSKIALSKVTEIEEVGAGLELYY